MITTVAFIIGLFFGAFCGVVIMCAIVSGDADDEWWRESRDAHHHTGGDG